MGTHVNVYTMGQAQAGRCMWLPLIYIWSIQEGEPNEFPNSEDQPEDQILL